MLTRRGPKTVTKRDDTRTTRHAWMASDVQREIAGGPFEVGDVIETDREFVSAALDLPLMIVGVRRWICVDVMPGGRALMRADDGTTP